MSIESMSKSDEITPFPQELSDRADTLPAPYASMALSN